MSEFGVEGHVKQYTEAKTTDVDFARDGGMHQTRSSPPFVTGCTTASRCRFLTCWASLIPMLNFEKRVRRFAGLYMNEDPGAPNYDPERRIIRSMFRWSGGRYA